MHAPVRTLRTLTAGLALAAAIPALAQDYDAPPPPPEQLPWAPPERPAPPQPPRARPAQPVYRPDAVYGDRSGQRYRPPPPMERVPPPLPDADPRYARAPRVWYPQVELAFRAGMASPGGHAADGLPMADLFGDQLAVGVELGVRTTPHLALGVFAEGGFGAAGQAYGGAGCLGAVRCDTSSTSGRIGVGLRYHLAPYSSIDPWIGYGVAISGATVSGEDALGTFSRTLAGVEYAKLSVGADLKLSRTAAVGFFAEWSNGVFTSMRDREDGVVVADGHLSDTTHHSWFTIGPRLRF